MRHGFLFVTLLFATASIVAACGGSGSTLSPAPSPPTHAPQSGASCPPPSPIPTPVPAWLAYPPNGSASVPIGIGEIVEQGTGLPGTLGISVSSPAGPIPLGTPAAASSPFPSPFATPDPNSGLPYLNQPYVAVPLPTLSPSTTYTVNDVYTGWDDNPPQCSAQVTQFMGSFTTSP